MTARLGLVVGAAIAIAWLILGLRAVHLERAGVAEGLASHGRDAAALSRARGLLHEAERLTPDRQPQLLELQLLIFADRPREALVVAQRVTRAEPDNLEVWSLVLGLARRLHQPGLGDVARNHVRTLSPRV